METDSVFYNFVTGRPQDVISTILRKISAYSRLNKVRSFKIGITNNPEVRVKKHAKYYDEMIVIYRTTSYKSVCQLETDLIKHNEELADNMIGGGGGRRGDPPYYMYVVLKHK